MKRIIAVIAFTIVAFGLRAQTVITLNSDVFQSRYFKVTGHVVDSTTNENLSFVSAYLRHTSDTLITNFALSDADGKIELPEVTTGNYVLTVEYLGYKKYQKEFYVRKEVQLGEIRMIPDIKALNAASVSAAGKEVEFKQDTIIFNAGLFKTGSNDNLAALLKRMPGVEISKEGTVTVNGKAVDKITIEGKTFFMNDNTAALNNLPASIVDKIKVIDKDSEEAQISGIRDIEKQRVMDVELKEEYKKGFFGNIKLAGGAPVPGKRDDEFLETDRAVFNSSLMASYYNDKDQLTFIGSGQNVSDDATGIVAVYRDQADAGIVPLPQDGIHTSWSAGANLNTDRIKKVSTNVSARYSEDRVDYHNYSDRITFQKAISDLRDKDETFTAGMSKSVNVNAEIKNLSGKKVSFLFRPTLRFGNTNQDSNTESTSSLGEDLQNTSLKLSGSNDRSVSTSTYLQATAKISSNPKRRLGLTGSFSFMNGEGDAYDDRTVDFGASGVEHQYLTYDKSSRGNGLNFGLTYTEPVSDSWSMVLMTSSTFNNSNQEKLAYDEGLVKNDIFSSLNQTRYTNHMARLRAQYSKNSRTIDLGATANLSENRINSTSAGVTTETGADDWLLNVSPYFYLSTRTSKDGNMVYYRLNVSGRVQRPGASSTMSSLGILSPTRLSVGNIYLKPYSSQNAYLSIDANNKKGQSLTLYFNGTIDENSSSNAIWYDSKSIMYTVPVNVKDPKISSYIDLNFTSPLTKDGKFRINTSVGANYQTGSSYQSTGIKDGFNIANFNYMEFMNSFWGDPDGNLFYSGQSGFQKSKTTSLSTNMYISLRMRLDNFEMNGSVFPSFRNVRYSLDSRADLNTVNVTYSWDALYTSKHDFEFQTEMDYVTYKGYRDMFNDPICTWKFSVNKNIKALTLGISVLDILNQARTRSMSWNDNYSQYQFTNTIGRCVLASVKFNFGKMNSAKASMAQNASINMLF